MWAPPSGREKSAQKLFLLPSVLRNLYAQETFSHDIAYVEVSSVGFCRFSPGLSVCVLRKRGETGENCEASEWRNSVESCHVSGCHEFVWAVLSGVEA